MAEVFILLKLIAFIMAVLLFIGAGRVVWQLRKPYRWTDPRGLQPEYHGANFRPEMRRFYQCLGGGVALAAILIVFSVLSPT